MEKRNTILLTVIAIATLLVAVVGATFAYFTASTQTTNTGNSANVTTNELNGATITFNGTASKFEKLDYPGGIGVYGAKAEIAKQVEGDKNDYQATFNLKIEYSNNTSTPLDWELWMVSKEDSDLNAEDNTICELQQKMEGNTTKFWYSDKDAGNDKDTTSCSGSAIIERLQNTLSGTKIASGKLKASTSATIDKNTSGEEIDEHDSDLQKRVINTKDLKTKYYYLVVKYPNTGKDQTSTDKAQTISVTLKLDGTPASELYTPAA